MIGIYRIKNIINDKCYYGSSKDINKRWLTHKRDLNKNNHINILLQRAWDKYGGDNFIFEIVELCDVTDLLCVEQNYLDLKPAYNIGLISNGGDNISNNPNRIKIIENIRKGNEKWLSSLTPDEIQLKFSRPHDTNPNWRGGTSVKYCKCGNVMANNAKTCSNCRDRTGNKNPFYNKSHTNETKKKLSEEKIGKYDGNQNIPIIVDGIEYSSAGEASVKLNIPMVTIRWRVKSDNPKFCNYIYK
jgi:group I intron endonuclease